MINIILGTLQSNIIEFLSSYIKIDRRVLLKVNHGYENE